MYVRDSTKVCVVQADRTPTTAVISSFTFITDGVQALFHFIVYVSMFNTG